MRSKSLFRASHTPRNAERKTSALIYRFAAAISALVIFLGMSYLYEHGDRDLYRLILHSYGVLPFQFPFVDISGSLAAWECARQGVDVILSDPCDVLHRGYNYSPLWLAAATIPLDARDTAAVGWILDLLFIGSLSLLPPPQRPLELVFVLGATFSTMVVFALERANPDILLFMLAVATGLLAECGPCGRLLAYIVALVSALLKYYPIMALVIVFRERRSIFITANLMICGSLTVFWKVYQGEIARGLPNIANGPYNTDLFAAKNLPFLLGEVAGSVAETSSATLVGSIATGVLYAALVGACVAICRRLLRSGELHAALVSVSGLERGFLVIGSALIAGCFFAGQSIGYRGVFLLLVMPGLLAISRTPAREIRNLGLGASVVIVLLMWGECFRLALHRSLADPGSLQMLAGYLEILFWLLRELGWWWTISVMLAVLVDFLWDAPMMRWVLSRFDRSVEGVA
jgi:hypothetical protein